MDPSPRFRSYFTAGLVAALMVLASALQAQAVDVLVSSDTTDDVKRYHGTTGAFIDTFASGGGLEPTFLTFTPPAAIPEPSTLALLAIGLAGLVVARWRKRGAKVKG